jgi:hydroxymethylglutaryl-CoA reductase
MKRSSRIPAFYKLSLKKKIEAIKNFARLNKKDLELLGKFFYLEYTPYLEERLGTKGENIVGVYVEPYRIATNFLINNKNYLIPMVTEEKTIVAGASNAAKLCRYDGGIQASYTESTMLGQVLLYDVDRRSVTNNLRRPEKKNSLLHLARKVSEHCVPFDIEFHSRAFGDFLVAELFVDTKDAMGAGTVTEMCERLRPELEKISKGKSLMGIVSNYDVGRLVSAKLKVPKKLLGKETVERILLAYEFAKFSEKRAVTHNKGIMNGVIALAKATGQDDRAIEASVHNYACRYPGYKPLSQWYEDEKCLIGELKMPMHVGTVGGATNHPMARLSFKILGIKKASQLAEIMGAVGLVQNLAALRSLVTEGITEAHKRLEG